MALINQQGMYNGSAPLNPLPYVNIAMQARQRKAAREEALNKYYENLPNTVNDKGLRDQEIPIIEDYKKRIYEYGVTHREALRKGDGAAKLGLDQLFREATSVSRKGQNANKNDFQAGKFFLEKNNQYALNSDEYIKDHARSQLPVTHPDYQPLDLEKYATNRPFDEPSFVKDIKTKFPYSEKVVRTVDPSDPNYEFVTTLPVLDEKSKIQMVSDAADRFHNDPTFRKKIQKDLADTGQLPALVQILQEQFGLTDPTEITDELIAAAYTYSKLPIGKTRERVQANYTNRTADKRAYDAKEWDRRTAEKQKNALINIAANKRYNPDGTQESGNSFDEFGGVTPIYIEIQNEGGFGSVNGKIDKGVVFDKDGNLFTGEVEVNKKDIPVNVSTSLSAGKVTVMDKVPLIVKDGVIVGMKTNNGIVDREKGIRNLQKKANTEPIKAPQPAYGKTNQKAPVSKPAAKKGEADDL